LNGYIPGGFGVTVFFFLSGYLITTLLRREAESTGGISLSHFYLRRVLRIFPPMYLVIVVSLLLTRMGFLDGHVTRLGLAAEALFFVNYYQMYHGETGLAPGMGVLWSLAVEEHFYMLFPLIYIVLRRCTQRRGVQFVALGAMWAAISAWRCILVLCLHGVDATVQRASLGTDTRLDSILIGCMLAIYGNPCMDPSRLSQQAWKRVLAAAMAALLVSFFLPGIHLRESIRYSIQNWALVPVFICAIRYPKWLAFRWANIGWIRFVGVLSYSLYLVHAMILHMLDHRPQPHLPQVLLALALSFLASYGIYIVVERPCAKLRKRLSARA
jgi:peptidoglycan/LPS O-acetylase OafA/YrhL